jgi:hypothetical protein
MLSEVSMYLSKVAAFTHYVQLKWRSAKLRLEEHAGPIFDCLTLVMVVGAAVLF